MIKNGIGVLMIFIGAFIFYELTEGFLLPFISIILIGVGGSLVEWVTNHKKSKLPAWSAVLSAIKINVLADLIAKK